MRPPICCSRKSAAASAISCDVGLGYLTLDRQSRTLSGGEVQRINLTTALGTSLVNTLFVLDEPSIGLHPRDMQRVIGVMKRLRDAGNSLVVVEHDPQIMLEADRILDMGPGAGERGGADRLLRHARRAARAARLAHRRIPERSRRRSPGAAAPRVRTPRPPRWRQWPRRAPTAGSSSRAPRAQPQEHRRAHSAEAPGVRHRRLRLGQIDAGARTCCIRRC